MTYIDTCIIYLITQPLYVTICQLLLIWAYYYPKCNVDLIHIHIAHQGYC